MKIDRRNVANAVIVGFSPALRLSASEMAVSELKEVQPPVL
jgi:hypothetical protein